MLSRNPRICATSGRFDLKLGVLCDASNVEKIKAGDPKSKLKAVNTLPMDLLRTLWQSIQEPASS